MYRDDRGLYRNRLVDFWATVSLANERSIEFIRSSVAITSHGLDWLFGKKNVSFRFVAVSMNFSVASIFAFIIWVERFRQPFLFYYFLTLLVTLYLFLGLVPSGPDKPDRSSKFLVAGSLLVSYGVLLAFLRYGGSSWSIAVHKALGVLLAASIGVLVDLLVLSLLRAVLEGMRRTTRLAWVCLGLLFNLISVRLLLLALSPGTWIHILRRRPPPPLGYDLSGKIMAFLFSPNLLTLLVSAAVFLVMIASAVHLVVWPTLARLSYAIVNVEHNLDSKDAIQRCIACLALAAGLLATGLKLLTFI